MLCFFWEHSFLHGNLCVVIGNVCTQATAAAMAKQPHIIAHR